MKRLFATVLAALLMTAGAFAQLSDGDYRFTAGGGFTMFSIAGSDADAVKAWGDINAMPGFYFGGNIDYAFSTIEGLTVEPGAYIMHYGKTFRFGTATEEKSYHANYLRLPLNIKYTFPLETDGFEAAVFTGPRINLGLGGNMFSKGDTYPGLKPLDAQWGIGAAVTIQEAVVIRAGYDIGITKCIKDKSALGFKDVNAHRNTFYFGVGFAF